MKKEFYFSVIVPVYNVEEYLRETLESVLCQTIGFEDHIQMILVDDGSSDNSGTICGEYQKRYPDNIIYVRQENGGVSSARNHGLDFVEGIYVNFLDSDDRWSKNAFELAYDFFRKHPEDVDVVAARIQFFEAKTNYHVLDYKFKKGTRVVDIEEETEFHSIQSTAATTFIKASAIGELRYDSRLKYGEDATFINKIILKKKKYGLLEEALYYYRRRETGGSAVNAQRQDKSFYINSLLYYHMELEHYSKALYGKVLSYIQALIVYDAGWRIQNPAYKEILDEKEQQEYLERLREEFSCMEDRIILKNRIHKSIYKKAEMLELVHGGNFMEEVEYLPDKQQLNYRNEKLMGFVKNNRSYCIIDTAEIQENAIHIEGRIARWFLHATRLPVRFVLLFDGKEIQPELTEYAHRQVQVEDGSINYFYRFVFHEPLGNRLKEKKRMLWQPLIYFGEEKTNIWLGTGKFVPSNVKLAVGYRFYGNYQVRVFSDKIELLAPEHVLLRKIKNELHFYREALREKEYELMRIRTRCHVARLFKSRKKELWLISDRMDNAGDNGEVFFRYVTGLKLRDVKPVFVIGKDAACVPRLKALGKVIYFESKSYPYYFLTADKIISSGAAEFTINALGPNRKYMTGFYQFKYYYLQHGVACADLSSWLNKCNKNIYRIFTSSPKEQEAFCSADYYYEREQIKLTGMARFDALRNGNKKQILIMPTWRRSIGQSYDAATNSVYYDGFKETEYFKFYNSLINDERLLAVMRRNGYSGLFCLHPIHKEQYIDFQANDVFSVNEGFVDYNQCFEDSSLTVTDYSSVLFDFAYLRKPVIYAQFDKEAFFEGQIYDEGYFSYERDGFGPVCYDYESTVEQLIRAIENDCRNTGFYLERVNRFFAFSDNRNCERIYQEIHSS